MTAACGSTDAATVDSYSLDYQIDGEYPPTYIIHCEDDDQVDFGGGVLIAEALNKNNVRHVFDRRTSGGHGFGLGLHKFEDDWVKNVLEFIHS